MVRTSYVRSTQGSARIVPLSSKRQASPLLWVLDGQAPANMGDDNTGTTSEVLMAAAKLIGKGCGAENKAFLLCKKADRNPEACLEAGKTVTACSFQLCVADAPRLAVCRRSVAQCRLCASPADSMPCGHSSHALLPSAPADHIACTLCPHAASRTLTRRLGSSSFITSSV